jgi:hypothetical protein
MWQANLILSLARYEERVLLLFERVSEVKPSFNDPRDQNCRTFISKSTVLADFTDKRLLKIPKNKTRASANSDNP